MRNLFKLENAVNRILPLVFFMILAASSIKANATDNDYSSCETNYGLKLVSAHRYSEAKSYWSSSQKDFPVGKVAIAILDIWENNLSVETFNAKNKARRFTAIEAKSANVFWTKCANRSDPGAILFVGTISLYGITGKTNIKNAERWFLSNKVKDQPIAILGLAEIYATRGDTVKSRKVLSGLIKDNKSISARKIGDSFFYGAPFNVNYQEAAWWFKKAAAEGDAYSQLMLSDMYRAGKGVAKNNEESHRWYELFIHNPNKDSEDIVVEPIK
jgi:TPR repeat protein